MMGEGGSRSSHSDAEEDEGGEAFSHDYSGR